MDKLHLRDTKQNKTGVINDPLGQPTVPAGSDCRLILKFWDGLTDALCENSDHYFGRPRGSIHYFPHLPLEFKHMIIFFSSSMQAK